MEVTISALSLRQPWAAFVVYWQKWIENRYWNTSYRGEFLIHAAKGMTRLEFDEALEFARPVLGDKCPSEAELRARLQFGGIIGRARLVGVVPPRGRGTILFTGATASVRGGSGFAAFAAAKFGLRAVAQSMARELGPKNIHVAHLIIDGGIDSEAIHRRLSAATGAMPELAPDALIQTSSVAEAYWMLHRQARDGWTHELDLRAYVERW